VSQGAVLQIPDAINLVLDIFHVCAAYFEIFPLAHPFGQP